jgi:hypothetical protein
MGMLAASTSFDTSPARSGHGHRLLPGRIDLDRMREELNKNSFDVSEDQANHRIIAVAPQSMLSTLNNAGQKILSMRVVFDTRDKTLAGTEITTLDTQNNLITAIQAPMYQIENGEPVMVGTVTDIRHSFNRRLNVSDRRLPVVTDPSSLPRTNEQDLNRRIALGAKVYHFDPLVGDPADPDYTDTYVERFENLKLNAVDDGRFTVSR